MNQKFPCIVIVGRPNVGKSTLFNRIVGRRLAVVEDTPGVTRDRLYAEAEIKGNPVTVIDTGGILFSDEDPLIEQIRLQAEVAIAEADIVLFLVDCADGVNPSDIELANRLRGLDKPILILANKADNPRRASLVTEFYELGIGEIFPVSGLHGLGVREALDQVAKHLKKQECLEEPVSEIRLAIVGRPNVGKSSLLNAFTGDQRAIVSDIPGTTRDAIDTLIEHEGEKIRIIDTAGLRRRGKIQGSIEYYMALRSKDAVERADCVAIVMDGSEGLTDGDKRTAKLAHDLGKSCLLVVNKWDLKEPEKSLIHKKTLMKKDLMKIIENEFPELKYMPICFTSAKEATGLKQVLHTVFQVLESWNFRISTGQLNKVIQEATYERPYTRKGRALRIYYATQGCTRPPTFVLFCNHPDLFHFSYLRYIENKLRGIYKLPGTRFKFIIRSKHEQGAQ